MSAFLPLATTERKSLEVRFVPMADMQVQTLNKASTSEAYERPADALSSGSISDFAENGFSR